MRGLGRGARYRELDCLGYNQALSLEGERNERLESLQGRLLRQDKE